MHIGISLIQLVTTSSPSSIAAFFFKSHNLLEKTFSLGKAGILSMTDLFSTAHLQRVTISLLHCWTVPWYKFHRAVS